MLKRTENHSSKQLRNQYVVEGRWSIAVSTRQINKIFSAKRKAMKVDNLSNIEPTGQISTKIVSDALAYVQESEVRVLSISGNGKEFFAVLKCCSPTYTLKSVEYLSTSELAISSAQVGQVVLNFLVNSPSFPYHHLLTSKRLSLLRENHQVYFLNWQVRFHQITECKDYLMNFTIERMFTKKTAIFAHCRFHINNAVEGSFTALIPGDESKGIV